jgi:hypothetical protein
MRFRDTASFRSKQSENNELVETDALPDNKKRSKRDFLFVLAFLERYGTFPANNWIVTQTVSADTYFGEYGRVINCAFPEVRKSSEERQISPMIHYWS